MLLPMRLLLIILTLGWAGSCWSQDKTPTLKFGINQNYAAPFILRDQNNNPNGGILFDLMNEIAREMKLPASATMIPRNRIEQLLGDGTVDMVCRTKRAWFTRPDNLVWTDTLFDTTEIIIGQLAAGDLTNLSQLNNHSVGTVIGFEYPLLSEAIANGSVTRDDAPSEESLLKKMVAGRSAYAIVDAQTYYYFVRQTNHAAMFGKRPFMLQVHETGCAISKKSKLSALQLSEAVRKIRDDGRMAEILNRYH